MPKETGFKKLESQEPRDLDIIYTKENCIFSNWRSDNNSIYIYMKMMYWTPDRHGPLQTTWMVK